MREGGGWREAEGEKIAEESNGEEATSFAGPKK